MNFLRYAACAFLVLAGTPAKSDEVVTINELWFQGQIAEPISGKVLYFLSWSLDVGDKCSMDFGKRLQKVESKDGVVIARVLDRTKRGCPEGALLYMGDADWAKLDERSRALAKSEAENARQKRTAEELVVELRKK